MGTLYLILVGPIRIPYADGLIGLDGYLYQTLLEPLLGDYPGSLAYALLFVVLNWSIGYILYKKKIYIKI